MRYGFRPAGTAICCILVSVLVSYLAVGTSAAVVQLRYVASLQQTKLDQLRLVDRELDFMRSNRAGATADSTVDFAPLVPDISGPAYISIASP
jgi:hypothetical protein